MAIDKRKRSSSRGGSGGTLTSVLSSLFGQGGETSANQLVDSPEVPNEFGVNQSLNTYLDKKGNLTSSPFSSNYNFFDRLAGRVDQAKDLNTQLAFAELLGKQNNLSRLSLERGLIPVAEEKERSLESIKTQGEVERRKQIDPLDIRKAFLNTYATQGIDEGNIGALPQLKAKNTGLGLEGSIQANNILNAVFSDPANLEALKAATLAKEFAPVAALQKTLTGSVSPGEVTRRMPTGNALLDSFINPMEGQGMMQQKGTKMVNVGGKEFPVETIETVPGRIGKKVPADPAKVSSAIQSFNNPSAFAVPNQERDFNPPLNTQLIPAEGEPSIPWSQSPYSFQRQGFAKDFEWLYDLLNPRNKYTNPELYDRKTGERKR